MQRWFKTAADKIRIPQNNSTSSNGLLDWPSIALTEVWYEACQLRIFTFIFTFSFHLADAFNQSNLQ